MTSDPMLNLDISKKPAPKALLERHVEKPVCRYAEERYGMNAEKFKTPAQRSKPDRIFSCKGGFVFFIEFKAPGKPATPKQKSDHERRRDMGFHVFVCDDVAQGKKIIDDMNGESQVFGL